MKATILDTVTGETATISGISPFNLSQNNYACDCNRNLWDVDTWKEEGTCKGSERFLVIAAEVENEDEHPYSLEELNRYYPRELKDRFLKS